MSREWTAKWIGRQDDDTFNPVFFKDFTVDFPISKATFYITAMGVFEAYINGQRVGNAYLTPYQTGEKDGIPYYEYDITNILYAGPEAPSNSIDVFLGHGWNDNDNRIALRAEVVLERCEEAPEEALAMEFDELEAEPGDYADSDDYDLFDLNDIDSFVQEEDPFEASDDLLNELIGEEEPVLDDAPELPELPESMDMPDTLAGREYYSHTRRMKRWRLELVQDPEQEAAKELLADAEPDFEIIAEPDELPEEDLFSEDAIQELMDENDFADEMPDDSDGMPFDVLAELEGMSDEAPAAFVPAEAELEEVEERGFSDSMPDMEMTDDEIQSILEEQEKQLSASLPKYFDSVPEKIVVPDLLTETDLEEALGDSGDLAFDEAVSADVDSLTEELDAEFSEEPSVTAEESSDAVVEPSGMTAEEQSWNEDVEGQVSFDFIGKIEAIMDEEKAAKAEAEALSAANAVETEVALEQAAASEENLFNTKVFNGEFDSLMSQLMEEEPEAEASPEEPAILETAAEAPETLEAELEEDDFFDESILEDFTEEELSDDIFDEISGEIFEEEPEEPFDVEIETVSVEPIEKAVGELEEPVKEAVEEIEESLEEAAEEIEEPFEEPLEEEAAGIEETIEETTEEIAETIEETIEEPEEPEVEKKGFFKKHFKGFDLAKKIGLTLGDEEEQPSEDVLEETDTLSVVEESDEYDEYDDTDLEKLDELFTDTSQLADLEAVLAGLENEPKAAAVSGPMGGMELPAFEDLFAEADSLTADKGLPIGEEQLFAEETERVELETAPDEEAPEEEALVAELLEEMAPEDETIEDASPEEEASEVETPEEQALETEEPEAASEENIPAEDTSEEMEDKAEEQPDGIEGAIPVPVILPGTGEDTEEEADDAESEATVEPVVVIGTDESWGYYGSDIEENRIRGLEVFNRLLWEGKDNPDKDAVVLDCDIPLFEAEEPQITVQEELQAQIVNQDADEEQNGGEWILDFGKTFRGFVSFQSDFPAGSKISLTIVSSLEDEGQEQQFVYVSDGIQETVCPHFAFFDCRYVKVAGWKEELDPAKFTGYRLFDEVEAQESELIEMAVEEPEPETTEELAEETAGEEPETISPEESENGIEEESDAKSEIEATEDNSVEGEIEEPIDKAEEENTEETAEEVIDEIDEAALDEALDEMLDEEFGETFAEEQLEKACFVSTSEAQLNQAVQEMIDKQNVRFAALAALGTEEANEAGESVGNGEPIATGDFCALMATSALNGDIKEAAMQYFGKLRKAQLANGKTVPAFLGNELTEGTVTDSAAVVNAVWSLYETYGDKAILEENYDLIKDAVDAAGEQDPDKTFILSAPKLADDDTDPSFVATVSYYEMAQAAEKAAKILGKEEDGEQLADLAGSIKEAFLDEFFTRSGRLAEDTQTAYVLALKSGLCDQKEKLTEDFLKQLKKDGYQLKCGKIGRTELPFVLADCGQTDLAYRYLMNDWTGGNADELAAENNEKTAEFLTKYVNGITALEPGFSKVKIAPVPNFRLIDAAGSCETPKGTIVSNWDVNEEGQVHFHFEIPEGCEAQVVLPECDDDTIKEQLLTAGSYDFDYMPQKDYLHLLMRTV